MFTVVWSHSHRVQCGEPSPAGAVAEKNDRAWRYFSELKGASPFPSNAAKTRVVSGRGGPQQVMILPVASITMFLYSQWQVWPSLAGVPLAARGFHGLSNAR